MDKAAHSELLSAYKAAKAAEEAESDFRHSLDRRY